jgi:hypothetical protein
MVTAQGLSGHLVEIIALVLLPVAIAMCGYAIFVFKWRSDMISKKRPQHFDDRVGPLGLCCAVVLALTTILLVSFIDFIEFINSKDTPPGPEPSPALGALGGGGGIGGLPHPAVTRLVQLAAGHTRQ